MVQILRLPAPARSTAARDSERSARNPFDGLSPPASDDGAASVHGDCDDGSPGHNAGDTVVEPPTQRTLLRLFHPTPRQLTYYVNRHRWGPQSRARCVADIRCPWRWSARPASNIIGGFRSASTSQRMACRRPPLRKLDTKCCHRCTKRKPRSKRQKMWRPWQALGNGGILVLASRVRPS